MQCKCGGDTKISESVNKKLKASLEFYECRSCGRVSSASLWIEGVMVAEDPDARMHYQKLDKDFARQLLEAYEKPPQKEEGPVITSASLPLNQQSLETFQTGSLF